MASGVAKSDAFTWTNAERWPQSQIRPRRKLGWTSRGQCVPPDAPIDVVANDAQPPKSEPDIFDEIIASQQR